MSCLRCKNNELEIMKLQEHHVYQIDENRKVSRRLDELEKTINLQAHAIAYKNSKNKFGLSFDEAVKIIDNGGKVKRKNGSCYFKIIGERSVHEEDLIFSLSDCLANDWEIVE